MFRGRFGADLHANGHTWRCFGDNNAEKFGFDRWTSNVPFSATKGGRIENVTTKTTLRNVRSDYGNHFSIFSQANVSRVITSASPAVQPVDNSAAIENTSAVVQSEKTDVPMEQSDNVPIVPDIGHNISPVTNDVKRAKYDETIDVETPSTSCQGALSKVESASAQMEVEEEPPEIIEVRSFIVNLV